MALAFDQNQTFYGGINYIFTNEKEEDKISSWLLSVSFLMKLQSKKKDF